MNHFLQKTSSLQHFGASLFLFLLLSLLACSEPQTEPPILSLASGTVERVERFPSQFVKARNVDIWLPEGYSNTERYPVLYMHDGQMLFDKTHTWNKQEWGIDEAAGKVLSEGKIRKTIIVGMWSTDLRHSEYFPQKPFESLRPSYQDTLLNHIRRDPKTPLFSDSVCSDKYLKFIVNELKPYIDSAYSTQSDSENTFIAGSSMGGLISMYAICEYPEIFGKAACLSTHWPGSFEKKNNPIPAAFFQYMQENLPDPASHAIYFDYGTETLDAWYAPFQPQADTIMVVRGYTSSNWLTRKFDGHDHSENSWQKRIHIPLAFLLGS
jgi:enterochelin esterase-like enzyme